MKTGIFFQVRLGSRRLREKALLPVRGGNIIQHAMRALKQVPAETHALLTDASSAESLRHYADTEGYSLRAGPDDDVLARYDEAAKYWGTDLVVRATGDNPLVSAKMTLAIIKLHLEQKADLSHFLGPPLGTGVEVLKSEALFRMARESRDPFEREHMTTYIYRNRNSFKVLEETCSEKYFMPEARVSVDDPRDYELVRQIYDELYRGQPIEIDELVSWLRRNLNGSRDRYDRLGNDRIKRTELYGKDTSGPTPEERGGNRTSHEMSVHCPESG